MCSSPPSGSSLQHLLHHRPRRLRPCLALPGGGRSDVHFGICRVHWSSTGKHFPPQVCKYPPPLMVQAKRAPIGRTRSLDERRGCCPENAGRNTARAMLFCKRALSYAPAHASLAIHTPPPPHGTHGGVTHVVTTAFPFLNYYTFGTEVVL